MSAGAATQSPSAAPSGGADPDRFRRYAVTAAFLAPALVLLGVWVVYPTVYTFGRSFFNREGDQFVWFDNYRTLFTTDILVTAIRNNVIWLAVVPAFVTAVGLIFAVLTERISWSVAFKTAVFMPMAISLFAAGVIWRIMDQKEPERGTSTPSSASPQIGFNPPGALPVAFPATPALVGSKQDGYVLRTPVRPGGTALMPLTGIPPGSVPPGAVQAKAPAAQNGAITGWSGATSSPAAARRAKSSHRSSVCPGSPSTCGTRAATRWARQRRATTAAFTFTDLEPGVYHPGIAAATFAEPFNGVNWLGPKLITPAAMIAYIWVWAGFSMVVIAAGLAAIPRDTLEAARTDGATEWQVFRRVTVPLLAPVLSVVFITMLINVLKVFDIILSVAPGSVQDDANVVALAMWRTSFGGVNDFGLGSAIAVLLFLAVIPILLLNVRRFRREV